MKKKAAPTPGKFRYRCSRQGLADSRVAVVRASRPLIRASRMYHEEILVASGLERGLQAVFFLLSVLFLQFIHTVIDLFTE